MAKFLEEPAGQNGLEDTAHQADQSVGVLGHNRTGEEGAEPSNRRGDGDFVVVEDDGEVGEVATGLVEGLEGHAAGEAAVADDGDHVAGPSGDAKGLGHAHGRRDGGRGVAGAEGVVFGLGAPGKAGEPAQAADGGETVAAAGENFMRIGLVADVPDQPVIRGIEDVVQGDGQLDHPQAGGEVPAGLADGGEDFGAEFVRQPGQVGDRQATQVGRGVDEVEKFLVVLVHVFRRQGWRDHFFRSTTNSARARSGSTERKPARESRARRDISCARAQEASRPSNAG